MATAAQISPPSTSTLSGCASSRPHVVIIGGGFGGLYAASTLRHAPVRITLIDRRNHHLFQPLLYQVATAALAAPDIATPLRRILRDQTNTTVLLGEVQHIDTARRCVRLQPMAEVEGSDTDLTYDYLIVATGATHAYYGHDEWAAHAPGLKDLDDAMEIRSRILLAYEAAERETDLERRRALLTFVVIGAGPTGAELAGALAEIAHQTMAKDFRRFDPSSARVLLLDGAARVLPTFPSPLSEKARQQLVALGVEVRSNAKVTRIDAQGVWMGEELIPSHCVLWAAGVAASPLAKALGVPLDRAGRVITQPDLTIPDHPEIYTIGDVAAVPRLVAGASSKPPDAAATTPPAPPPTVPGVAPAAIQEGRHAARNILLTMQGKPRKPFIYHDKGSLATIGRRAAVAAFGKLHLSGFFAWWAWLWVHVFFLIGFRNRFVVLFEWAWDYFTFQRSARIIMTKGRRTLAATPSHPPAGGIQGAQNP